MGIFYVGWDFMDVEGDVRDGCCVNYFVCVVVVIVGDDIIDFLELDV